MIKKDDFLELLQSRYSCKGYDSNKKISKEDFEFILEAGRLSPSSFGFEPWQFLVFNDEEKIKKISEFAWGIKNNGVGVSHLLVVLSHKDVRYDSKRISDFISQIQRIPSDTKEIILEHYESFQKNDFCMSDDESELISWSSKQSYIAMQNMLLASSVIGVNSCPIEGFNREKTMKVLEEFGVEFDKFYLSYMIVFGYSKDGKKREKTRRELKDIVKYF